MLVRLPLLPNGGWECCANVCVCALIGGYRLRYDFFVVVAKKQDYDLQQKLKPMMVNMKPLPSIYFPDFIAANQSERADNVLTGTKQEQMDQVCFVVGVGVAVGALCWLVLMLMLLFVTVASV